MEFSANMLLSQVLLVVLSGLLAFGSAWVIFKIRPATKDDATRLALHKLELFCPPNWGQVSTVRAGRILSRLYRDLQYASRGNSFIITRAAAWKMHAYLRDPARGPVLTIEDGGRLYVWKTLIACALGNQHGMPVWQSRSQRNFKVRMERMIMDTRWVLHMFNRMNSAPYQIPLDMLDELAHFQRDLLSADQAWAVHH